MSKLTRREFVKGAVLVTTLPTLPEFKVADETPVSNLTPADVAWAKVPEAWRSAWYQNQEWKQSDDHGWQQEITKRARVSLTMWNVYPYPRIYPHPRPDELDANRRAALHQLVDEITDWQDLECLFELARGFVLTPKNEDFSEWQLKERKRRCGGD